MVMPLIQRLTEEFNYPIASPDSMPDLLSQPGCLVLFFPGNLEKFPESGDVAVILPELVAAFPGQLNPAVVQAEYEEELRARYPFDRWPGLVFLRSGVQIGTISKVRSWAVYLETITSFLNEQSDTDDAIPLVHI